ELADLRRQVEARQRKRLASLHTELGFSSADELISAIRSASSGGSSAGRPTRTKAAAPAPAAGGRASKRARITPEMRREIEAALLGGEKGATVARRFGISYPSLHKIKTQIGLVTQRPSRRRRRS